MQPPLDTRVVSSDSAPHFYYFAVTDGPKTGDRVRSALSWQELLTAIASWADEVTYVATTPDLFEQVAAGRELLGSLQQATNTRFTADERAEIDARIDAVRAGVRARDDLSHEQLETVLRMLGELQAASRRVGRKDWVLIVLGTTVNLAVAGVPVDVVQHFAWAVLSGLAHLFGVPGPPPALPA